jgi:hypothetical protein
LKHHACQESTSFKEQPGHAAGPHGQGAISFVRQPELSANNRQPSSDVLINNLKSPTGISPGVNVRPKQPVLTNLSVGLKQPSPHGSNIKQPATRFDVEQCAPVMSSLHDDFPACSDLNVRLVQSAPSLEKHKVL